MVLMIIINIFKLLISSALTVRKHNTVYYSRIVILTLCVSSIIAYNNLYVINLKPGIGLYGGIFNITSISQSFNIFIFLISAIILMYNSFYHTTLIQDTAVKPISLKGSSFKSFFSIGNPITTFISYVQSGLKKQKYNIINNSVLGDENKTFKMGIYRMIEYPLIILFIITGAVFLMN